MKTKHIIIFLIFFLLHTTLAAADNPKAVIIFDASGSMWGQIEGKPKISIAKEALKKVVQNWNTGTELGLTVYGHRTKGDCNDIETVVPIGNIDPESLIQKVESIQPKGKTPISKALRKVADKLRHSEEASTIILISDGQESCDTDPCATAKALKAEGINVVAHVIGFHVDKQTDAQLSCIATATGGEYFSAQNASDLNDAMGKIAQKVEAPRPIIKKLPYTLAITASETEDGKWIAAKIDSITNASGKKVAGYESTYKDKPRTFQLPSGQYTINLNYHGLSKKALPFEIKAGEVTRLHIVMGTTGKVEITASETGDGKWINAKIDSITNAAGKKVAGYESTYKDKPRTFQLPSGQYTMNMHRKNFQKHVSFEVKAGETSKVHVNFMPFHLEVKGVHPCTLIHHEVISPQGKVVIETNTHANQGLDLVIPDGTYFIESSIEGIKKKTEIQIGGTHASYHTSVDFGRQKLHSGIAGLWDTSWEEMTLHRNGNKVNASYALRGGRLKGTLTYPQRFDGYWIQNISEKECATQQDGSKFWGRAQLEFDDDMCRFKAKWGYCDGKLDRTTFKGSFIKPLPQKNTTVHIQADTKQASQK